MPGKPLHFNVMLNTINRPEGPARYDRFSKAVVLAQELGFDGIFLGNSYAQGGPDPFILLGHALAIAPEMQVGTSVFLLPMRHPTTTAFEVATLDQLAGGRFLFGVGVGGERGPDFTLNGIKSTERGARLDESLDVMHALWSGEEMDHQGRFYNVSGRLKLTPAQQPMRVMMGARGGATPQQQRVYKRVIDKGRGWLPYIMTPSGYGRGVEAIRALGGGDDILYGLVEMTYVGEGDGMSTVEDAAIREAEGYGGTPDRFRSLVLAGNREMVIERMNAFADLGCTEFVFNWACPPDQVENQMRILAADIIPAVRAHAAQQATVR